MNYSNQWATSQFNCDAKRKSNIKSKFYKGTFYAFLLFSVLASYTGIALFKHYKNQTIDYSNMVYNDPFRENELKPDQRYILNYCVAREYLKQEVEKHPQWSDSQIQLAAHQIENLFHVKNLTLNQLSYKQQKQINEVYNFLTKGQ